MQKSTWYLKQLLPLTYWSTYQEGDPTDLNPAVRCKTYFTIWRMWFGVVFDAMTVEVNDYWVGGRQKSSKW